jgi:small subunit ribosomal protein S6
MAKNKPSKTPHYELLYIIPNKYSEDELKPIQKKVEEIIAKNKGTITYREEWGKKKLAYPINHYNYGYYNLLEFDMEGKNVAQTNELLRITPEVLRHMIVVKTETAQEAQARAAAEAEKLAKETTEEKEETKKEEKDKIDLEELDSKLDNLLDVDNLL